MEYEISKYKIISLQITNDIALLKNLLQCPSLEM